jgi:hypothetical protein
VLACALRGAAEQNVETQLIELGDYELVFYGQVPPEDYPADVARLRGEVATLTVVSLAVETASPKRNQAWM